MEFTKEFFRIIQFTDLHLKTPVFSGADAETMALVRKSVREYSPDLLVFTGDVVHTIDSVRCMESFVRYMDDEIGLPWTFCFGNHDAEQSPKLWAHSHAEIIEVLLTSRHGLYRRSKGDTTGQGTHDIELRLPDGTLAWVLYLFDNRFESHLPGIEGYCHITGGQIQWLRACSVSQRTPDGEPVPALVFMHNPLPEHDEVWEKGGCKGNKFERVCCAKINSGLFTALLERGGVRGVYAGHDHVNDYEGELYGIRLGYGRASGLGGYGREGYPRGARVFNLNAEGGFDSFVVLQDA